MENGAPVANQEKDHKGGLLGAEFFYKKGSGSSNW
jgi:hypothetical protein